MNYPHNYMQKTLAFLKLEKNVVKSYIIMPTSHIQQSPAEFVDRPKVAKFHIRQGVERIFSPEIYAVTFQTGLGRRPLDKSPGARYYTNGSRAKLARHNGRAPFEFRSMINRSVDARPTPGRHSADTRAGSNQRHACVLRCAWMLRDSRRPITAR